MTSHGAWSLPPWVAEFVQSLPTAIGSDEERMRIAIELSARNVEARTGGPFGAAIFAADSGRLVAVGVNAVVPNSCSHAHAEMMAIARAQADLGVYDLGAESLPVHELVTSCEPCAMCFGAIPWSGVRRVVCGASESDARAIGFDEGPRMPEWQAALRDRGIEVMTGVCAESAREVLQRYARSGGEIYNSRQG